MSLPIPPATSARARILGIDASNISSGGGLTHLAELLRAADPEAHGFERVVVWAARRTLDRIDDRPWLLKRSDPTLDAGLLRRAWWQRSALATELAATGCDLLFVPGGSYAVDFAPVVTMSQNLLPFEWRELRRYGWSTAAMKQLVLRWIQTRSSRRAAGMLFLTEYAQRSVLACTGPLRGATAIVPHGLDPRFRAVPRSQRALAECSDAAPFRLLYVSTIDQYKHQWHVAEAIAALRAEGLPLALDFIGAATPAAARRLTATLDRVDPARRFLRHLGVVDYRVLHRHYRDADAFVFASSCENLPNILIEAMAAGLPIASSRAGPMPEVLGDAGVYFDPEDAAQIATAVRTLAQDPALRAELAGKAHARAAHYDWHQCAERTFGFLARVARGDKRTD